MAQSFRLAPVHPTCSRAIGQESGLIVWLMGSIEYGSIKSYVLYYVNKAHLRKLPYLAKNTNVDEKQLDTEFKALSIVAT